MGSRPQKKRLAQAARMIDIDSGEILAYVLTDDRVGDNRAFIPLMNLALGEGYHIRTVFTDNAY